MSNQFNSDDEVLACLVREAGDPSISPDPHYAETLRTTILGRVAASEAVAHVAETIREAPVISPIILERTRAKDFFPSRKYACEDAGTNKGAGVAADDQSSLITALKQRDRSAWSAAVDRHLHEVYGFVFHLVGGDRAVAEDLNQETWLEALDGIDQCDAARGSFRNWLFGIARKRVALHYRRRALAGNPTSLSDQFEEAAELGDISVLPEDVLEQVERDLSCVRRFWSFQTTAARCCFGSMWKGFPSRQLPSVWEELPRRSSRCFPEHGSRCGACSAGT